MWEKVTEYNSYGIQGCSFKSKEEKFEENFTIGIFFSSPELRCLVSSQLLHKNSCEVSIIVFFKELDDRGLRAKHDTILYDQVCRCSKNEPVTIKERSIHEAEGILCEMLQSIPACAFSGDQEWFVDVSVSPSCYLGFLGYLRDRVESPKLTLFNSTGDYEKGDDLRDAFSFTLGFSKYMWVPWLWGRPNPLLPWTYFFLLGFEGDRSYEIYDRFEPDFVKALVGKPGYRPEYVELAKDQNAQFIKKARPQMVYANAADAVETWQKIEKSIEDDRKKSNICIVPLGPKPHAVGGCLAALTNGFPAVMYLMPRSYKVKNTPRGEYIWKYEITL